MYEINKNQNHGQNQNGNNNKNNYDYAQKKQNVNGNYYKNNKGRNDYESVCTTEDIQERMKIIQNNNNMSHNKNKSNGSQDNCK